MSACRKNRYRASKNNRIELTKITTYSKKRNKFNNGVKIKVNIEHLPFTNLICYILNLEWQEFYIENDNGKYTEC